MKERVRSVRTRNQKLKGLVFSCKVVDCLEELRSDMGESDFEMSTDAEPITAPAEPMDCEFELAPIAVEEYSSPNDIMVKFQNQQNSSDEVTLDCEKDEKLESVLSRFSNKVERELSEFTFSNRDYEPLEKSAYSDAIDRLPRNLDADYIEIFYTVVDYKSPKWAPREQSTPTLTPIAIVIDDDDDHDPNEECRIQFEDRSAGNGELDMDFAGNQQLSEAISQIVDVMELNLSNTQFFNSKGIRVSDSID